MTALADSTSGSSGNPDPPFQITGFGGGVCAEVELRQRRDSLVRRFPTTPGLRCQHTLRTAGGQRLDLGARSKAYRGDMTTPISERLMAGRDRRRLSERAGAAAIACSLSASEAG